MKPQSLSQLWKALKQPSTADRPGEIPASCSGTRINIAVLFQHVHRRGLVGMVVGTGPEKASNVATVAIVASFTLVMIAFFRFDFATHFELFYKILTTMLGPVGLALGYLFGSKDKSG
ncbi:hypothetical protein [Rhizobium leguminosarum]